MTRKHNRVEDCDRFGYSSLTGSLNPLELGTLLVGKSQGSQCLIALSVSFPTHCILTVTV